MKKIFPVDEDTAAMEALRLFYSLSRGRKAVLAAPSYGIAEQLFHEFEIWAAAAGMKISACLLPEGSWRDTVTLDDEAERAEALALAAGENPPDLFIGSVLAFLSPTPDPREFCGAEMLFHRNDEIPMGKLVEKLVALGYDDEPEAVAMGEFSRRGGILDIYSPGMKYPVRLEFFGDQGHLVGENIIGQIDGGTLDAMFCGEVGGYDAQQDTKDVKGEQLDVEFGNMYTREIESFGNSILNNLPLEVPASDAVQVQRVMEAAYRSNDNKCVVDL